jgi:membrane protein CcdC involved in cytochrome C biogenesis
MFSIIVLYSLGVLTELELLSYDLKIVAGLLSIVTGTFMFIQAKTLDKPVNHKRTVLEIILFLGGIIILVPGIYDYFRSQNTLLDGIIISGYVALLLLIALFTRNEHVSKRAVRKSEQLFSEDYSNDPRFQKMMRK